MDELIINGESVELGPATKIGMTYQVNDIAELRDIKANTTNEFAVPNNSKNAATLGFADLVTSSSVKPYQKNTAVLKRNGQEVIKNGVALIEECSDAFRLQVLSGNYDFFKALESKKITELDFSDMDHLWDLASVVAAIPNTVDDTYTYPVIDYTGSTTWFNHVQPGGVRLEKQYPAVFAKKIIERIASENGYSVGGSYFDDAVTDREIIPFSNLNPTHAQRWVDKYKFKAMSIGTQTNTTPGVMQHIEFPFELFDTSNTYTNVPADGGRWYTVEECNCGFKMVLKVSITAAGPIDFRTGFRYWNPLLGTFSAAIYAFTQLQPGDYTITIETTADDLAHVIPGSYIIPMYYKGAVGDTFQILAGSTFENNPDPYMYFETSLQLESMLPDITQKEFIKATCAKWCLVSDIDDVGKVLILNFMNDLDKNRAIARNWSGKLDVQKKPTIAFRSGKYAQTNNFKYTADDAVTEGYGDGSFAIPDSTLDLTADIHTLPFAATEMKSFLVNLSVPFIKVWNETGAAPPDPSGDPVAVKPRILLHHVYTDLNGDLKYVNEAGGLLHQPFQASMAWFIHTEDQIPAPPIKTNQGFDDTMLDDYYWVLKKMLTKMKKVTAYFNLHDEDVQDFDHMIPVYIEKFQEHFFVNKISNYQPGRLTQVELFRL